MIIQVRGTGLAILFFLAAGMNAQKGRSACMKGGAACALIGCQRGDCLQFASPRLAAITFVDLLLPNRSSTSLRRPSAAGAAHSAGARREGGQDPARAPDHEGGQEAVRPRVPVRPGGCITWCLSQLGCEMQLFDLCTCSTRCGGVLYGWDRGVWQQLGGQRGQAAVRPGAAVHDPPDVAAHLAPNLL